MWSNFDDPSSCGPTWIIQAWAIQAWIIQAWAELTLTIIAVLITIEIIFIISVCQMGVRVKGKMWVNFQFSFEFFRGRCGVLGRVKQIVRGPTGPTPFHPETDEFSEK